MDKITNELFKMQDLKYKTFHSRLMPTVEDDKIIGVRVPELRKYARMLYKSGDGEEFIKRLPHGYYEENNIHAFIVEQIDDYDRAIYETERFLPYIDNWATCDMFLPKVFKKNKKALIENVYKWISSDMTYTVRYGIGILMSLYLDGDFEDIYLKRVASVKSEEYYVNMMIAWYFATALAKQYEKTMPYITEYRLEKWVHNKTIQKACESGRINKETKELLKSYKLN